MRINRMTNRIGVTLGLFLTATTAYVDGSQANEILTLPAGEGKTVDVEVEGPGTPYGDLLAYVLASDTIFEPRGFHIKALKKSQIFTRDGQLRAIEEFDTSPAETYFIAADGKKTGLATDNVVFQIEFHPNLQIDHFPGFQTCTPLKTANGYTTSVAGLTSFLPTGAIDSVFDVPDCTGGLACPKSCPATVEIAGASYHAWYQEFTADGYLRVFATGAKQCVVTYSDGHAKATVDCE